MKTITLIFIAVVVYTFFNSNDAGCFALIVTEVVLWLSVMSTIAHLNSEAESLKNPQMISENDAGKILTIVDIKDNKVALKQFGYIPSGIGTDFNEPKKYYYISEIPKELRERGIVFKITQNLKFQKVQVNGYSDKSKKPFEIIPQTY